jgi:DNA-binding MarR family transcriptional regulator
VSADWRYGEGRETAAIRCTEPFRRDQLHALIEACALVPVAEGAYADWLLADISSDSGGTKADCSEIADYLDQCGAQALVWVGVNQVDEAFAALPVERVHFLVEADDVLAVPILATANRRAKMDQLHDNSRESEYRSLHKISDELADFARTLARIAEQEAAEVSPVVRDAPVSFRPASAAIFAPMVPEPALKPNTEAIAVRNLIKLRRLRDRYFDASLFADPAWDILLDLYAARLEGRSVSVSSLCIAAAVPPTTALRWITSMTEHGALVRRQDPDDARRVFIELSDNSADAMRNYLAEVGARGVAPI